jgi:hypothetical protein
MYHKDGRKLDADPVQFGIFEEQGWTRQMPDGWEAANKSLMKKKAAARKKAESEAKKVSEEAKAEDPNADVPKTEIKTG